MRDVSSAYWLKMQDDASLLTEIIDLELPTGVRYHFTTTNAPLTYTLSGSATRYFPFQGTTPGGIEESNDLGVSVVGFTMVNTHAEVQAMLSSDDFKSAVVKIGRVFTDTPDLDRMEIYQGTLGDFSYNRLTLNGQLRNLWKSLSIRWPYYNYQDKCQWTFGSSMCGFDTSSITIAIGSINVASSTMINLLLNSGTLTQSYSDGRFDFGRATVTLGANSGHVRTIRVHTGDLLELSHPLPMSDLTGIALSIYPGCRKRLLEDCHSLYNNARDAFAWPWIPKQENAFVGQ
jgi:hypothetical protein